MKTARALLLLAVALPLGAAVAQPAGPPANPMTAAFKGRTSAARRNILQAFDSIPESKFSYKPTPAQLTFGFVAAHLAEDDYFFCSNFGDKKPSLPEEDTKTPDAEKAMWPKEKLVTKLKAAMAFCDDAMNQLDDANIGAIITVPGQGGTTRQVSRMNYVLGHALDLADHYSQIANYMRLNGMLPPTALPRPGRGGDE